MGLRADSARPQRVSGSARTDSQRAESARNTIASHVNFGDDSALSALTRTQWTAAFTHSAWEDTVPPYIFCLEGYCAALHILPGWVLCRFTLYTFYLRG